jgi:hypothetical protein
MLPELAVNATTEVPTQMRAGRMRRLIESKPLPCIERRPDAAKPTAPRAIRPQPRRTPLNGH